MDATYTLYSAVQNCFEYRLASLMLRNVLTQMSAPRISVMLYAEKNQLHVRKVPVENVCCTTITYREVHLTGKLKKYF